METKFTDEVAAQLKNHIETVELTSKKLVPEIVGLSAAITSSLKNGGKLLVMGNGGSAADSQHFVAEIVGRFKKERAAWPAIALSTDTSILTAIGNDYGFDEVFSRQVEAHAVKGDIAVGISTSGNSSNVEKALILAKSKGCVTAALLGKNGGIIKDIADISIVIPTDDTPRIQENHILIIHIVCDLVERGLTGEF